MIGWRGQAGGDAGFSLVELVAVLAIITTLLGIATFAFHDWQVKSNVEAQVRQMVTDISELRLRAMTMKQRHSIMINSNSYVFRSYSSDDEPKCSGTAQGGTSIPGGTHNVSYKFKRDSTTYYAGTCSNIAGDTFEIDQRGLLVGSTGTVFVDFGGSASVDCLTLHTMRVNIGKTNGASCDDR